MDGRSETPSNRDSRTYRKRGLPQSALGIKALEIVEKPLMDDNGGRAQGEMAKWQQSAKKKDTSFEEKRKIMGEKRNNEKGKTKAVSCEAIIYCPRGKRVTTSWQLCVILVVTS